MVVSLMREISKKTEVLAEAMSAVRAKIETVLDQTDRPVQPPPVSPPSPPLCCALEHDLALISDRLENLIIGAQTIHARVRL